MQQDSAITCLKCGHENSTGSVYCGNCGSRIDGVCPNCGTQNAVDSRYCNHCGTQLSKKSADDGSTLTTAEASSGTVDCPRCHHINEPGSRFCFNCGLPFDEPELRPTEWSGIDGLVGVRPAGFWIRLVAMLIDSIIVLAVMAVIITLFFEVSFANFLVSEDLGSADVVNFALSLGYPTLLVGTWAATVGKRVFHAQILRPDGTRVGYGRALVREAAKILSAIILGIGFFMVAFRRDKRGLHDIIADTVVVMR